MSETSFLHSVPPKPDPESDPSKHFDCKKCGDGDALRKGESCAYCGLHSERP